MNDGKKTFDVEETLRLLTEAGRLIESTLTEDERKVVASRIRKWEPAGAEAFYANSDSHTTEDFDLLAAADAAEVLAIKVRVMARVKEARRREQLLDVYYAMEG